MPQSHGYRKGTRHMFARKFREHGMIKLSTYLQIFKVGDIVDIKANSAQQRGMPHKYYHGRTGIVYNVTKSAVGVIVNKRVGGRYLEKRVNVRIEHVRHSRCREDFVRRVKQNAQLSAEAKASGQKAVLKRIPAQPREGHFVSSKNNVPTTMQPIPYDTLI